jgi:DNA-binding MarR family transcriptional regulator/catechol 2,3-dioxygenase-like lactoylglutathione lyase family enzyme
MAGPDEHEPATPALMRAARGVYAQSIRAQLQAIGADDLPRNGAALLAGIAATGAPRPDLPAGLGVTKQAVSQAIDILASRGYLERHPDPADRRRITLALTARGQEVLDAVVRGTEAVDAQLLERVPAGQVRAMRSALLALAEIKTAAAAAGTGKRRPPPQFRQFSPIFPVRDMAAALAHYAALGFDTHLYSGEDNYGFADREGTGLHLSGDPGHDPGHSHASAYLYVRDADALYEEWTRPGTGGRTLPAGPRPYGLREGAHIDPDGNLIRFGSPLPEQH